MDKYMFHDWQKTIDIFPLRQSSGSLLIETKPRSNIIRIKTVAMLLIYISTELKIQSSLIDEHGESNTVPLFHD